MTSRRRGRALSPEEEALWRTVTATDKPLAKRDVVPPEPRRPRKKVRDDADPVPLPTGPSAGQPRDRSLDAGLAGRLRRGRLPVEGTIDLHGLTLREAQARLDRYIAGALALNKRCILVITGKGAPPPAMHERDYMPDRPRPGAIRAALPGWLNEGPHAGAVLAFHPAQPKDGGGGAFYVLLRRQRDK